MLQDQNANPKILDNPARLEDADAVLQALGLSAPLSRASTAPSNVSSLDQSRTQIQSPDLTGSLLSQQSQQQTSQQFSTSLNESFVIAQQQQQLQQSTQKAPVPLEVVHVNQINIAPKERVYYTKSTQTPAPIVVPQTPGDSAPPTGDAPQQKSYYGKQMPNVISPSLQPGQQMPQNLSANNSLSGSNTQVAGINQLALEWDDEFPGMSRLELEIRALDQPYVNPVLEF